VPFDAIAQFDDMSTKINGLWVSAFANGSPRVAAAKSISLDVFKIGQPQGPARS
jgi:hypothetical protein